MTSVFDRLRAGVTTSSAEETRALAAEVANTLSPNSTVALHGDLGVGKTTFVQGLAEGLGIRGHVTSPTYTVYTIHRGPRCSLVHLDAYRIENPTQLEALMIEDFLAPPYCLAIEWPERAGPLVGRDALHIELRIDPDTRHTIRLR